MKRKYQSIVETIGRTPVVPDQSFGAAGREHFRED